MIAQAPDVAFVRHGLLSLIRNTIGRLIPLAGARSAGIVYREIYLGETEPCEFDVELEIDQALQFDREQFRVPVGILRNLVGQNIGPALCLPHMGQSECGHLEHAKTLRRMSSSVAGQGVVFIVDRNRVD